MITFDLTLSDSWQEVLSGGTFLAFDVLSGTTAQVYFSESASAPSGDGNKVLSFGDDWDFHASGLVATTQRIWVKGSGQIRGVR